MKRSIPEYEQLAKRLLQDRAITELGSDTVLCYRVAEPREKDASDAILELLEALDEAKEDLAAYAVCGTCSTYEHCKNKSWEQKRGIRMDQPACYRWKWRGGRVETFE